jgi:hypothetical protein
MVTWVFAIFVSLSEHDPEKWKPVFGQDHAQLKKGWGLIA